LHTGCLRQIRIGRRLDAFHDDGVGETRKGTDQMRQARPIPRIDARAVQDHCIDLHDIELQ